MQTTVKLLDVLQKLCLFFFVVPSYKYQYLEEIICERKSYIQRLTHSEINNIQEYFTLLAKKQPQTMSILSGHCLCHSSTFSVPVNSIQFGFASCHCSICRLSHGAPFVLWSGLSADQAEHFSVQSSCGLSSFASSPVSTCYFCSKCGSHVYIKYADGPDKCAGEVRNAFGISFLF